MHPRPALLVAHRSQLAALGEVFKSCEPVRLTEEDTEYSVFAIKHVYDAHVVVQFNCTNTIQEQVLEGVTVAMDLADAVSGGSSVRGGRVGSCCGSQICTGGHQLCSLFCGDRRCMDGMEEAMCIPACQHGSHAPFLKMPLFLLPASAPLVW